MKKKVRFDVPATFSFSCPLSVSPGQGMSEDLFPNSVFPFKPPEPLPSHVAGEPNIEPEEERVVQEEEKENQQTTKTAELDGESGPQEQPQGSIAVEGSEKGRENEVQAEGIFGHPAKTFGAVTMPARSIFGHWPTSQLAKPFGEVATSDCHAVGIFGEPAKPGAVTTPSTGFRAMPESLNFGGFASNTEPATSLSLFESPPTKSIFGSPVSAPGGFGSMTGTSTAGVNITSGKL